MRRLIRFASLAVILAVAGYTLQHYDLSALKSLDARPKRGVAWNLFGGASEAPDPGSIRIASFNIQVFGAAKMKKPQVVNVLVEVVRRFDVIAIQEIRSQDQNLLPQFLDMVNATGRHYEFAIGPRLGRTNSKEQYAFIFDADRIEIDRSSIYTVDDPDDLLHREPLVAAFRVRGPPASAAFTFTLVNIHTDPDEVLAELNVLDDVIQAVRNDGRGEDDVILLGDLNADDAHLGDLGQLSNLICALSQVPTNTRGNRMYDNILFDRLATSEYEGRAGVLDLQAEFNLTLDQALEISDHLPIWAQFRSHEGGHGGILATRPRHEPKR
jgi:endonuclease/exonuclease/phosphatase family metal-dependent hydrolase